MPQTLYTCYQCGQKFNKRFRLKEHENIHNGIKQYSCSACPRVFTRKHDCKTHERLHSGQKLFACGRNGCEKSFARRTTLRKHQQASRCKGRTIVSTDESCVELPGTFLEAVKQPSTETQAEIANQEVSWLTTLGEIDESIGQTKPESGKNACPNAESRIEYESKALPRSTAHVAGEAAPEQLRNLDSRSNTVFGAYDMRTPSESCRKPPNLHPVFFWAPWLDRMGIRNIRLYKALLEEINIHKTHDHSIQKSMRKLLKELGKTQSLLNEGFQRDKFEITRTYITAVKLMIIVIPYLDVHRVDYKNWMSRSNSAGQFCDAISRWIYLAQVGGEYNKLWHAAFEANSRLQFAALAAPRSGQDSLLNQGIRLLWDAWDVESRHSTVVGRVGCEQNTMKPRST